MLTRCSIDTLTKNVYRRLPREVRDMIYAYILTPQDVFNISRSSLLRMDGYPYPRSLSPEDSKGRKIATVVRPAFIDTNFVYAPFAAEVIQCVYEMYRDFWIDMPSAIPAFLEVDFFELSCKPKHARLSKLHISGLLDAGQPNSIVLETLATDFQAILDCHWAPNFDLDIAFRTELGFSYFGVSALETLAYTIHTVWKTLHPFIIEAEKRGARVYFVLLTKAMLYRYMHGEHNMFETKEEWESHLQITLGHLCWRPRTVMEYSRTDRVEKRRSWNGFRSACDSCLCSIYNCVNRSR